VAHLNNMDTAGKGFNELSKLCKQASILLDRFEVIFSDLAGDLKGDLSIGDDTKKRKKKKERDPDQPRRPESAYFRFQKACIPQISAMHPNILHKEKLQIAAKMWQDLDDENKKKWEEAYQRDLIGYIEENAKYKAKISNTESISVVQGSDDGSDKKKRKYDTKKKMPNKTNDFDFADPSKMAYI